MDNSDEFEQELYDVVDLWDDDMILRSHYPCFSSSLTCLLLTEVVGRRPPCEPPPLVFIITVQLHHSS